MSCNIFVNEPMAATNAIDYKEHTDLRKLEDVSLNEDIQGALNQENYFAANLDTEQKSAFFYKGERVSLIDKPSPSLVNKGHFLPRRGVFVVIASLISGLIKLVFQTLSSLSFISSPSKKIENRDLLYEQTGLIEDKSPLKLKVN